MADKVIPDVTLSSADPHLVLCWEEKVSLGAECSLLLKHSKGKIITILKSSSFNSQKPKISSFSPVVPPKAGKKKPKKARNNKKRLESLLAYHQRLVTDKGMPPSKLMLQHAATAPALPVSTPTKKEQFSCNHCEYSTPSKLGLVGHKGIKHKGPQRPEVSCEEVTQSPAIFGCSFCKKQYDSKVRPYSI